MDIGVIGKLGGHVLPLVELERNTAIVNVSSHFPHAKEILAKGEIVNLRFVRILAVRNKSIKSRNVMS